MVIKTLDIKENPLSDYGSIIKGERFIGRTSEIGEIHNRVLGKNFGNISVMGLPRVGKSSLVWMALIEKKEELIKDRIHIIRIDVGEIKSSDELYRTILDESNCIFECRAPESIFLKMDILFNKFINEIKKTYEKKRFIKRYFKLAKQLGYRFIIVLEEFDHIKNYFRLEDFQLLRELSTNPETKIALVTVSRRTIQEIELENGIISTLAGVFTDLNLAPFNEDDINEYWDKLEKFGVNTDDDYRKTVNDFTGSHPFLLDLFNYKVLNNVINNPPIDISNTIDSTTSNIKLSLFKNYDNIITVLEDEKLLCKLYQVLFGPVFDLDQKSIEKLLKYGIIQKYRTSNEYFCFSKYFAGYLNIKQKEIDIWPLWSETETQIRDLIRYFLTKKYSNEWKEGFLKNNPKKTEQIQRFESMLQKNKKTFGDRASSDLIDYTYPSDFFDCFISTDWNLYQDLLGGQKKDWKEKFNHLGKVRNPIAHNNTYFISENDYNEAIGICNLILEKISNWKQT